MEMALYEPGLGYYSAGATKLGAGGDFVTAPEISPLFSRCLATQCGEVLQQRAAAARFSNSAPAPASWRPICSTSWPRKARLPERYLILEVSADLRERQRATAAANGRRRTRRASSGSIACRRSSAASCSRTKCWTRCRCSAFASAATRSTRSASPGSSAGSTGPRLARTPALEAAVRRIEANTRRALAGWLYVGDQPAARAVDRRRRGGAARRRGAVHRLWPAAASVLPQRASRGHVAVPLPASLPRRSADQRRCAGHRRLGRLHRGRGSGVACGTGCRGLRDAGAFPDRQRHSSSCSRRLRRQELRVARAARTSGDVADAAGRNGRALQGDRTEPRLSSSRCAVSASGI